MAQINGLLFNHIPGRPLPLLHDCAQPCTTVSRKAHAKYKLVKYGHSKNQTLQRVLCLRRFENKAIVNTRSINEYCQYLFGLPVCTRTKFVPRGSLLDLSDPHLFRHHQNPPQDTYATAPRPPCSTRLYVSTGPSFRQSWPAMADTYRHTLQKSLMSI